MTANPIATYPVSVAGSMTLIQKQVASGSAESITFSAIPQGYTHLLLIDDANITDTAQTYSINFNGDSGAHYSWAFTLNNAGTVTGNFTGAQTSGNIGAICSQGGHKITIMGYANATNPKAYIAESLAFDGSTSVLQQEVSGVWSQTAAITSITLSNTGANFNASSTFSLYGLQ